MKMIKDHTRTIFVRGAVLFCAVNRVVSRFLGGLGEEKSKHFSII